jgi:H+/Cl- antiporter ClcA
MTFHVSRPPSGPEPGRASVVLIGMAACLSAVMRFVLMNIKLYFDGGDTNGF